MFFHVILAFAVFLLMSNTKCAAFETFKTALEHEPVKMICPSKESPIWERFSKVDSVKLAVGTTKRTTFDNERLEVVFLSV